MITDIFTSLIYPSIAGTCLAVLLLLIRPLTGRVFGHAWHYYIWLAVLFTMLLPVRFSLPGTADAVPPVSPVVQSEQAVQTEQHTDTAASERQPETTLLQAGTGFIKNIIDNRLNIIAYAWLAGAIILLLINFIGYIRLTGEIRKNAAVMLCPEIAGFAKRKIAVRVWENTSSPFMTGIIKPTLVLPARELTEEQLNNILRHEMTHLRRHDVLYKWFVVFVKCVHWFNPMIWIAARRIEEECEISCDMAVTLSMSREEEMSYINTLLSLLPKGKTKQIPLTTQMASSKKMLKRRFIIIKTKKATSRLVSALSAVTALVMLSTTVFASGVLSDLSTGDYAVEITKNGERIELTNKPFIENGEVYVPLREMFEKLGETDNIQSNIEWDNGKINMTVIYSNYEGYSVSQQEQISAGELAYRLTMEAGVPEMTLTLDKSMENQGETLYHRYDNSPIVRDSLTYVPYSWRSNLFMGTQHIDYRIYGKDGNVIDYSGYDSTLIGDYSIKKPYYWSRDKVKNYFEGDDQYFVHKATYDKYGEGSGILFGIEKVAANDADELLNTLAGSRLLGINGEYAYIFVIPTDVQYPIWADRDEEDIEIAEEYERLFDDVELIADSFVMTE